MSYSLDELWLPFPPSLDPGVDACCRISELCHRDGECSYPLSTSCLCSSPAQIILVQHQPPTLQSIYFLLSAAAGILQKKQT
ncbi:hypothetical protein AMECASPLE_003859 [Ameca splendens]|uniref:Uncharacterized protein n=1 Tax=Ameca splendens TaxID=208324 RepID=A0ABV0XZ35_9TELE